MTKTMTAGLHQIKPWPEHRVPQGISVDCAAFGLSGHGRLVWGEGDPTSRIFFLLDNPGAREDKQGTPFVCGTRQTLRSAAAEAGFDPDQLYVTFLVKCRPKRAYDKTLARRVGLRYVLEQLQTHRPKVVVLFGDVVVQTLISSDLGNDEVSVRQLRDRTLQFKGFPTVVTYHPLAARRRPNLYPLLVRDLMRAHEVLS